MVGNFHAKTIKDQAEKDYEKTWLETSKLIDKSGININWVKGQGKAHPLQEFNLKFRCIFLELGFDEMINPSIIEDKEVFRQYGPEAPLILDRMFYLAGLPRQDIGISEEKLDLIKKIIPNFSKTEELKSILRAFKRGEIEGDDFIEVLSSKLLITESQASRLIKEVFMEFSKLLPEPSHLTLRSHMTANWFEVLSKKQTAKMPVKLFSIGSRFRKEQRQDEGHLYESTSASIVVMNQKLSMEDGIALTEIITKEIGLTGLRTVQKKTTSKYYAPGYDWEIYAKFGEKEFEIANLGMYSPVSLSKYRIMYPVLNLGFGVERVAMILNNAKDIRNFVFPQYYGEVA